MKLQRLTMKNFMPYKGTQTVNFPNDPVRNVMIVFGDNMRGKTSLLNAIRWGFYGRAVGRHSSEISLHDLHNKEATLEGNWEMEVALQFEADGHGYELRRRSIKRPVVATPTRKEDFEVFTALLKDGMAVNGNLVEAEINQFAPEQVSRFFLFDGELLQEYESLLIEGSEQGRNIKAAIEKVLGVPALIYGRDDVTTLLRSARGRQTKDLAQVAGLERQAEQQERYQIKQSAHESDIADLKSRYSDVQRQRRNLDDELKKTEAAQKAQARIDALEMRKDDIIVQQKKLHEEKLDFLKNAWKDLLQPKIKVKLEHLRAEQKKIADALTERAAMQSHIATLSAILTDAACPTCGSEVSLDRKQAAGRELGELQGKIIEFEARHEAYAHVTSEITSLARLESRPVGESIGRLDSTIRQNEVSYTRVENDIEALNQEVEGFDPPEVARKRALRDQLFKNEALIENSIASKVESLDEIKRQLQIIARTIDGIPQARAQRSSAEVRVLMQLERVFGDSVERLRDSLRAKVEANATEAFRRMISQASFRSLQINKNYGLTILDENGHPVSIRSAGAEQIVALSLIDGLSQTGRSVGPVVMDTPFGRLDTKHRDNIIRYLPTATSQLVLLVHDGEIRKDVDLAVIAPRIGRSYEIKEISPRHSRIEEVLA